MHKCPNCGSTACALGPKDRRGVQQYICKKCKKAFRAPEDYKYGIDKTKCIYCGGETSRQGIKNGKQKYQCKVCKKTFREDGRRISNETKQKIELCLRPHVHVKGMTVSYIAKAFGVGATTVKRIKATIREKIGERIE